MSQQRGRPPQLTLDIPAEIFRSTPQLTADMPECLAADMRGVETCHKRVLTYGCSLTAQYSHALSVQLQVTHGVSLWMCGLSGKRASELVRMADHPAIPSEAFPCRVGRGLSVVLAEDEPFELALIMAGTNDLGWNYPAEDVIKNIKRLHEICHASGLRTVALSIPPNINCVRSEDYRERWLQVNNSLRDWSCAEGAAGGVAMFVDTADLVPFEAEKLNFYQLDGLHFSDEGCEHFASSLAPMIGALL
mmetsp:Transcript_101723/g.195257  ORF Transcript_101723/g.195257 Transcript_101723/m.195257 type:complete len:248 (+) Transcript_101723:57-800(+)